MNLYEFETDGICNDGGCDIISAKVAAKSEDEARNILYSELGSEQWLDKETAKCTDMGILNESRIISFEYDM